MTACTAKRLGLDLVQEGENLRLFDPAGNKFLLTPLEQARRAESAEEEIARLRAELDTLRNKER